MTEDQKNQERTIASYDTAKKTALPLQVEAPHNDEYSSDFDEPAGLEGERDRSGANPAADEPHKP